MHTPTFKSHKIWILLTYCNFINLLLVFKYIIAYIITMTILQWSYRLIFSFFCYLNSNHDKH